MLRRNTILTTAALLAVCAVPASADAYQDLRSPDTKDAASGEVGPPPSSIAAQAEDEYQDLRSPDAKDAAREAGTATEPGQDLRSPDAVDAAGQRGLYEPQDTYVLDREFGSPDAADAARDLPSAKVAAGAPTHSGPGPFTQSERELVESPEVQAMVDRISAEIRATPQVVEVRAPSGGFDWEDAGIGAAGMLGLFSIAAGSALMITGRRRRQALKVATH